MITVAILLVGIFGLASLGSDVGAAPGGSKPDGSTKSAAVACKAGWRGTAVGEYGGVGFSVSCNNDKVETVLTGVEGTAYSIRMGAENLMTGVDCFFSGDARRVRESCGNVTLTIR